MYFFAVMFCQGVTEFRLSSSVEVEGLHSMYGNLSKTLHTLFASASQGIEWNAAYVPLASMHSGYAAGFLLYITLIIFGVTNVVASVFVESAITSAQHYRDLIVEEKQQAREVAVMHMKAVFKQIDDDGSGEISAGKMERFLREPELHSYVAALGISVEN